MLVTFWKSQERLASKFWVGSVSFSRGAPSWTRQAFPPPLRRLHHAVLESSHVAYPLSRSLVVVRSTRNRRKGKSFERRDSSNQWRASGSRNRAATIKYTRIVTTIAAAGVPTNSEAYNNRSEGLGNRGACSGVLRY